MKIKISLLIFICFICTKSIAQEQINIHKSDNSTIEFNTSDVTDFTFGNNSQSLFVNKVNESSTELLVSEVDSITFTETRYTHTYGKTNDLLDAIDGSRKTIWIFDEKFTYQPGHITLHKGVYIETVDHSKFHKGYKIKSDTHLPSLSGEGVRLLMIEMPYDIVGKSTEKKVFGFWIDRKELMGETLYINSFKGGLIPLNPTDLATEGYTNESNKRVEVLKVDGDYSYVIVRAFNSQLQEDWYFNLVLRNNPKEIKEITLYNPTILFDTDIIDPYHVYQSESQKINSSVRGKTFLVMGDSQQNDGEIGMGLARKLGINVWNANLGGNRIMATRSADTWMYKWNARQTLLNNKKIDYFVLMISSNDAVEENIPAGDFSPESLQAVYDNYPVLGDDEETINRKIKLYESMSYDDKTKIFRFKQTYMAFIEQIKAFNPEAKIILATIPVSSYGVTESDNEGNTVYKQGVTPEGQRASKDHMFLNIRSYIYDLAAEYNFTVCDLYNEGGITWENLPTKVKGSDSVHWTSKAKHEFVAPLVKTILEDAK